MRRVPQVGWWLTGKVVDDSGSTDGKPWTASTTPWKQDHYTEAYQVVVDLGQVREIHKMTWLSGDANHSWCVDVLASEDGKTPSHRSRDSPTSITSRGGAGVIFLLDSRLRARSSSFAIRTDGQKEDI